MPTRKLCAIDDVIFGALKQREFQTLRLKQTLEKLDVCRGFCTSFSLCKCCSLFERDGQRQTELEGDLCFRQEKTRCFRWKAMR